MKKNLLIFLILALFAISTPGFATLISDIDPPNTSSYWTGSDVNPGNNLVNSNPTTEEAWLEGLLGKTYNDPTINFYFKDEAIGAFDYKGLSNYDPGFLWEYAVVKYDGYWAAYSPDGGNLLNTGSLSNGISHITFFNGTPVPDGTPVPEPSTLLLLGAGLIGLTGYGGKKLKTK